MLYPVFFSIAAEKSQRYEALKPLHHTTKANSSLWGRRIVRGQDISLLSNSNPQYKQLQFVLEFTMNKAQVTGVDSYIEELERFGISFANTSTEDAKEKVKEFLTTNTYYPKLRSYLGRTPEVGDFVGLDFKDLVKPSKIGFSFGRQVLTLALSIEHALKIQIFRLIELEKKTNLADCLRKMPKYKGKPFRQKAIQMSDYSRNYLVSHPESKVAACALWELLETFTFWELIKLFETIQDLTNPEEKLPIRHLQQIRKLRNAASHGNCLLARTNATRDEEKRGKEISDRNLYRSVSSPSRDKSSQTSSAKDDQQELSPLFLQDFRVLLDIHRSIVTSSGMQEHAVCELSHLSERIKKGQENFKTRSCQFMSEMNATLTGVQNAIEQFISPV